MTSADGTAVASRVTLARCVAALAVVATPLVALRAEAQPLSVKGQVVRETVDGARPVAGEMVTLHRVNARDSGPVDSIQTDRRGGYAFRVAAPDTSSMYLVSARYGGIAYFSQPLQGSDPGAQADVTVYDTTSANVPLQLQGRHVVVSAPAATGVRSVIDVLEIANDTILTRVPGADNRPTYSLLLPDGVLNVRVAQGEISAEAVEVRAGRADLFAPLSPGLRQVVLTYDLPPNALPLAVPLERTIAVLEVLLEEPGARASAPGLQDKGGVSVDGKTFTRFLGEASNEGEVLTLTGAEGSSGAAVPPWLLPLVLTIVTAGAILLLARRRPTPMPLALSKVVPADASTGGDTVRSRSVTGAARPAIAASNGEGGAPGATPAERWARRVATIDALLEASPSPGASRRSELEAQRIRARAALLDVLANRTDVQ